MRHLPDAEIGDVLLDQTIFAGVGNIIKNEVLFRTRTSPFSVVGRLSDRKLKAIVAEARTFSFRFLELRQTQAFVRHGREMRQLSPPVREWFAGPVFLLAGHFRADPLAQSGA